LMVLSVAVAGIFLDASEARATVVGEIRSIVGEPAATAVATIENPVTQTSNLAATALGALSLVFGALGVFYHLQDALNSIWRAHPPRLGWWQMVRYRLTSLAVVVATGFLLLVSLILSAALTWLAARMLNRLDVPVLYLALLNSLLSFAVTILLFALVFKLLPDTTVPWRHVWLGAAVTAGLFTLGKAALGLYLANARLTSAYGAAGSIVALLLWCYYAAQIVFLGAEFTRVTTLSDGGRDFSRLEHPLERIRFAHQPPPSVTVRTEKARRRRSSARGKNRG
jgi:membrane protein